jgi:hypothetical protein
MTHEGRKRFCADCKKHVHDLSAMPRAEAEALLQSSAEGSLCVRYIYDQYGQIMFDMVDPTLVPAARLKRPRFDHVAMAAAALTIAATLPGCMGAPTPAPHSPIQVPHPQGATAGMPLPLPPAPPTAEGHTLGEIVPSPSVTMLPVAPSPPDAPVPSAKPVGPR